MNGNNRATPLQEHYSTVLESNSKQFQALIQFNKFQSLQDWSKVSVSSA